MARLATPEDFESGSLYTKYWRFPFFSQRADRITGLFPSPGKILVAGCAVGYLVDELIKRGYDAWGCDASQYIVDRSVTDLPQSTANRVILADCRVASELDGLRSTCGLRGKQKFGLIITEEMLTALSDDTEVAEVLTQLRIVGRNLFHIVACADRNDDVQMRGRLSGLLWYSLSEWKQRVGHDDRVLNSETWEIE